ncbi:MAG: hypothetical protein WKG07_20975 [Hymenobacter sp.]
MTARFGDEARDYSARSGLCRPTFGRACGGHHTARNDAEDAHDPSRAGPGTGAGQFGSTSTRSCSNPAQGLWKRSARSFCQAGETPSPETRRMTSPAKIVIAAGGAPRPTAWPSIAIIVDGRLRRLRHCPAQDLARPALRRSKLELRAETEGRHRP